MSEQMRVMIKRPAKKKTGYAVEKRSDGFYYVTGVPPKKASIQPGDRVLEINGVPYTEFKSDKAANELFEKMVLDVIPGDQSDEEESDDEVEVEDISDDDLD